MSCPEGLLRCPVTKAHLVSMPPDQLRAVNAAISRGELLYADGAQVRAPMAAAYVSKEGNLAYGAKDDIVLLLPALAVGLTPHNRTCLPASALKEEKKDVKDYYDQYGWSTVGDVFVECLRFVDLRPVSHEYHQTVHQRARAYLKPTGRYILDAASGPINHPAQLVYSQGFDYRICLDFSFSALQAARQRLGPKAIYVLGDITNIPLVDDSVDGVISLHTLYHVPADEQKTALQEIYRVLKPEGSAVVVYSWGPGAVLNRLVSPNSRVNRAIITAVRFLTGWRKTGTADQIPDFPQPPLKLYYHSHPYSWFSRELKALAPFKLVCWRSVDTEFLRTYIREWLYGKQVLATIAWLESKFPWILGRCGQYPMFVIQKPGRRTAA